MLRSLVALLAFSTQWKLGACYSYWVDQSCANKIPGVIGDALRMAAGASLRLNAQDQNQQQLFTRIFKTQPNDANAVTEVHRVLGGIGTLQPTLDRPSSDVRIYCDNDRYAPAGRWSPVPDIADDPNPNSRKIDGIDKEYEDVLNSIGRSTRTQGCLDADTNGETYYVLRNSQNTVANQNPHRSSITLCDQLFVDADNNPIRLKSFFDADPRADFSQGPTIDYWEALISVSLLHELTHTSNFGKSDLQLPELTPGPDGEPVKAIGYELITNNLDTSEEALRNSDSYAVFALFARLADFRYRLDSDPGKARDGDLVYDDTLSPPDVILSGLPVKRRRRKRANVSPETRTSSDMDTLIDSSV